MKVCTDVAQRITVTIPDQLHERLQQVKDKLNISGLCQQAIEKAVEIEEIKFKDVPNMEKLLERLRMEKQQSEDNWKKEGIKDGRADAMDLSYDEFRALEGNEDIPDNIEIWVRDRNMEYLENLDEEAYLEGWKEGALSVWEQVKDSL